MYFILFDATVNEIVFLIYLPDSSLLVYGNTTDFCILILYPATLLNFLGFYIVCNQSHHPQIVITSSFPLWRSALILLFVLFLFIYFQREGN